MNGKKVKCWARNKINNKPHEAEAVHTLDIHCGMISMQMFLLNLCFMFRCSDLHEEARGRVH